MNVVFELLFNAWCPPYDSSRVAAHLRSDPVKAYGQYAFEKGFRLAMELAVCCLEARDLVEFEK